MREVQHAHREHLPTGSAKVHRSPRQSLSPYFVEEVAMTRSDVLRARDIEVRAGRKRK
jgi:hypothetical protein